jgi:hypothetical protein
VYEGGEKERRSVRGINISSAPTDFIRTQLHAKSVICSNRPRALIGSLRASYGTLCPCSSLNLKSSEGETEGKDTCHTGARCGPYCIVMHER